MGSRASVTIDVGANDTFPFPLSQATVTFTTQSGPSNGTVTWGTGSNNGKATYTPNAGFSGTDTFVYKVDHSAATYDTATVNVTAVAPSPTPTHTPAPTPITPRAIDDNVTVNKNVAKTINVVSNDSYTGYDVKKLF